MKRKIKVGVISMHRVPNYGSFLQAYATQIIMEKMGFDCEIIDHNVIDRPYHVFPPPGPYDTKAVTFEGHMSCTQSKYGGTHHMA